MRTECRPSTWLIKWYPEHMSAPHSHATERLCLVLSGTWWVNSGAEFDPWRHRSRAGRRLCQASGPHAAL